MKFKEYLFSYRFGGKNWTVSVFAASPDEAKEKIKAVAHAEYDGDLYTRQSSLVSTFYRLDKAIKKKPTR